MTKLRNNRHPDTKTRCGINVQDGLSLERGWGHNPKSSIIFDCTTYFKESCQFRPRLHWLFSSLSIADGCVVALFSPGCTVQWSFEDWQGFCSGPLTRGYWGSTLSVLLHNILYINKLLVLFKWIAPILAGHSDELPPALAGGPLIKIQKGFSRKLLII